MGGVLFNCHGKGVLRMCEWFSSKHIYSMPTNIMSKMRFGIK